MTIHRRIKERREALGLSMEALGERVGVVWQTIQQWEKEVGGTAPKRERLHKVAEELKTSPEYLLFGDKGESANATASSSLSGAAQTLVDLVQVAHSKGLPDYQFESIAAALRIMVSQLERDSLAAGD